MCAVNLVLWNPTKDNLCGKLIVGNNWPLLISRVECRIAADGCGVLTVYPLYLPQDVDNVIRFRSRKGVHRLDGGGELGHGLGSLSSKLAVIQISRFGGDQSREFQIFVDAKVLFNLVHLYFNRPMFNLCFPMNIFATRLVV